MKGDANVTVINVVTLVCNVTQNESVWGLLASINIINVILPNMLLSSVRDSGF